MLFDHLDTWPAGPVLPVTVGPPGTHGALPTPVPPVSQAPALAPILPLSSDTPKG